MTEKMAHNREKMGAKLKVLKFILVLYKTDKSKRKQVGFGGSEKRTKFRKKNLLGPFLIMVINEVEGNEGEAP